MATNNTSIQDLSGRVFRPINHKSSMVYPAISYDEERVAPKATYPQVSMYERWLDDIESVKVNPSNKQELLDPVIQVPSSVQVSLNERWTNDNVG